jgi:CHAT domain-containing protein
VATLWPIADADAAGLACTFYTQIADSGIAESARALHRATRRRLRQGSFKIHHNTIFVAKPV